MLEEWSLPEFSDVAALVASELITNSVLEIAKYAWAALPPVRLWLRGGRPGLAILVWDAIAAAPVPRTAGDDDESGRGLGIVADLSATCGFYHAAGPGGKVAWATLTNPVTHPGTHHAIRTNRNLAHRPTVFPGDMRLLSIRAVCEVDG